MLDFLRACSKYDKQNSVNLDESKVFSTQNTKTLDEGEPQTHRNMISYNVIHLRNFIIAKKFTLCQMKSVSQSSFHAEIGVNPLWSLKKQGHFLWLKCFFVNINCGVI